MSLSRLRWCESLPDPFPNVNQVLGLDAKATLNNTLAALLSFAKMLEERGIIVDAERYLPIVQAQLENLFLRRRLQSKYSSL